MNMAKFWRPVFSSKTGVIIVMSFLMLANSTGAQSVQPLHKPVYWDQWAPWSSCSATCGQGVTSRSRDCLSWSVDGQVERTDRWRCHGRSETKKLCQNSQECVISAPKLGKITSCKQLGTYGPYYRRRSWIEVKDKATPCRLVCQRNSPHMQKVVGSVRDHTPCTSQANASGFCEHGVCVMTQKTAGGKEELAVELQMSTDSDCMSGIQGKRLKLDMCLKCGGDNSSCYMVSKTRRSFLADPNLSGDEFITTIPRGATNISIKKVRFGKNNIAILSADNRFILKPAERPLGSIEVQGGGVTWHYHRSRDTETLQATGPTSEELMILVVGESNKHTTSYTFWAPRKTETHIGHENYAKGGAALKGVELPYSSSKKDTFIRPTDHIDYPSSSIATPMIWSFLDAEVNFDPKNAGEKLTIQPNKHKKSNLNLRRISENHYSSITGLQLGQKQTPSDGIDQESTLVLDQQRDQLRTGGFINELKADRGESTLNKSMDTIWTRSATGENFSPNKIKSSYTNTNSLNNGNTNIQPLRRHKKQKSNISNGNIQNSLSWRRDAGFSSSFLPLQQNKRSSISGSSRSLTLKSNMYKGVNEELKIVTTVIPKYLKQNRKKDTLYTHSFIKNNEQRNFKIDSFRKRTYNRNHYKKHITNPFNFKSQQTRNHSNFNFNKNNNRPTDKKLKLVHKHSNFQNYSPERSLFSIEEDLQNQKKSPISDVGRTQSFQLNKKTHFSEAGDMNEQYTENGHRHWIRLRENRTRNNLQNKDTVPYRQSTQRAKNLARLQKIKSRKHKIARDMNKLRTKRKRRLRIKTRKKNKLRNSEGPASCPPCKPTRDRKKHFCDSDFVSRMYVNARQVVGDEIRYDIAVISSFRKQTSLLPREYVWAAGRCQCPRLRPKRTYVVMGKLERHGTREARLVLPNHAYVRMFSSRVDRKLTRLTQRARCRL